MAFVYVISRSYAVKTIVKWHISYLNNCFKHLPELIFMVLVLTSEATLECYCTINCHGQYA